MKQYNANNIKNIAIVGHGGSGKTTLAEALLYSTGAADRLGTIADGTTVCDYDPEEIKRKASVSMAAASFEYKGCKVNLLDAPGLFDFVGGMSEAIRAADSVIVTISGKSGLTTGGKKAYRMAKKQGKARMIYVGKLDRESSDFYKVLEQLKTEFGPSICPLVVPFVEDHKVQCYIDLVDMKAFRYENGKAIEVEMPQSEHRIDGLITAISEAVAETDDDLFEKYFSGEKFTQDELLRGIRKGVRLGDITPVFCGSSTELDGIDVVLKGIQMLLPNALEAAIETAFDAEGNEVGVSCDEDKDLVAYVFKTVADPFVGKLSFVKVISGKLSPESAPKNSETGEVEKMGKLLFLHGKKQEDTKLIPAGDIGAVTKLAANTGDTLYEGAQVTLQKADFPQPCYSMAVLPVNKGDESKISQGIKRLLEEDLTLGYSHNHETHQRIISGLGEQHLDVVVSKLKSKFGVDVTLEPPMVAYRETIRKKVKVEGKHKKQSGGHGQFGHVWIEFEPCDSDELVFEEKVFGGAVPKGYFPAVEKGLKEAMVKGVVAGYPMVGLKATLVDGSYHPVDSSEMSFKMAASLAYKAGIPQASPVLLEPIGNLKVTVPDEHTGDMMGELNKRRGRVMGMNPSEEEDGMTVIEAEVPMSEMADFATVVRQMTQGSGSFTFVFERYEQLPGQLEGKVIEEAKKLFADE
ncbi:Vegetative protein 19 [uncultured Ruminococcus sp.]|uniref:elongation factor G n=1 Tax=Massiliimalia timonensis TaxID=1987501 RepID=UPI000822EC52|nr:elongation factor G [Massiliimalia timonensis]SCH92069.1 Vegetative protein 19 [uncultured Clostridium sp.]SCI24807.1 Vegetative protein 19 [uncultured Ruminococcus sp.]